MYLTNSAIVLPGNVLYKVKKISMIKARAELRKGFISVIGHQGTVDALKSIFPDLANDIRLNRIEIKKPTPQIVFKLKGRLPEGKILTATEIAEIGYEFWQITLE